MRKQILSKYIFHLLLFVVFFLLTGFEYAQAYGAPDYLPDGPHPRIFLTSEELGSLEQKRLSFDSDWTALEAWCDSNLGTTGYETGNSRWLSGYRYDKNGIFAMNYALAYQILKSSNPSKAQTYANYARDIMLGSITGASVGEEINGLKMIRVGEIDDETINDAEGALLGINTSSSKLGYSARSIAYFAVAYDWLHEALSESDREIIRNALLRWFDWQRGERTNYNNGVLVNGVRYYEDTDGICDATHVCTDAAALGQKAHQLGQVYDNFNSGENLLFFTAVLALHEDYPESAQYFDYVKNTLLPSIVSGFSDPMQRKGGESVEGWSYASGHWDNFFALYSYKTATNENIFQGFDYPKEVLTATAEHLMGDLKSIPFWGKWNAIPYGEARRDIMLPLVGIGRKILGNSNEVEVGQYLINNGNYGGTTQKWQELLFSGKNENVSLYPFSLPLSYLAEGDGMFMSRDAWNSSATHVTARLEGRWKSSKESYDEGTITIGRGSDRLLTHKDGDTSSQSNNTIVFNNANHRSGDYGFSLRSTPCVDRYVENAGYSYVSGDISAAWEYQYGANYANLFRRSVLHVRPGFAIVHDVTRSEPSRGNLKDWYTNYMADPSETADTISATVGSSKIFTKTLFPSGSFVETNPSVGYYRVKFTPTLTQEYDQFIHVIEATGSTGSQTQTTLIEGVGGRGALIGNSGENIIAMFTSDQNGADMTDLSYSANTSTTSKHIITSLIPDQTYDVKIDSGNPAQYVASDAGIIEFENQGTGNHSYEISEHVADVIPPAAPSGFSVQ